MFDDCRPDVRDVNVNRVSGRRTRDLFALFGSEFLLSGVDIFGEIFQFAFGLLSVLSIPIAGFLLSGVLVLPLPLPDFLFFLVDFFI